MDESFETAERAYGRALITLWVGNTSGALAAVAYITANRHDGTFTRSLLVPLLLFVAGLSLTGMASLIEFTGEWRARLSAQDEKVLNAQANLANLVWRLRLIATWASATCFFVAFIFCFVMLARN